MRSLPSLPSGLSVLAGLVLLAGCGAPSEPAGQAAGPTANGRALYLQHCSACHQPNGGGLSGAFPPLAGADWLREAGNDQVIGLLLRGRTGPIDVNGLPYNGAMPAFGWLDDAMLAAILEHVYASWGNDGRRIAPAEVAAQRQPR